MWNIGYKVSRLLAVGCMLLAITACTSLSGQRVFETDKGALRGYDPVAYFVEGKAVAGKSEFQLKTPNTTWYFSNLANKKQFVQHPEKYTPQYGGYCAYAMSYGLVVSSDPQAFSIRDGKLYLNYSLSVRDKWLKDPDTFIAEADEHWAKK